MTRRRATRLDSADVFAAVCGAIAIVLVLAGIAFGWATFLSGMPAG